MYRYMHGNGPAHVVAEGGWLSSGFPFTMRYIAVFERATVSFDLGAKPELTLSRDGKVEAVELDISLSGYGARCATFCRRSRRGAPMRTLPSPMPQP